MGSDTTCHTAGPILPYSCSRPDGGPQFTSHYLSNFLQSWGVKHLTSSPSYPQSNGKAEATVKSMKKVISAAWIGCSIIWDTINYHTHCSSTGTLLVKKIYCHLPRNYSDTQFRIHSMLIASHSHQNGRDLFEAAEITSPQEQERAQASYNQYAYNLPDLEVSNRVALQNSTSKMWDIYGTITATGPYRRYFIKTHSGWVLVRSRRFIRKRSPISSFWLASNPGQHLNLRINLHCLIPPEDPLG